jgi:hypothetical protein
MKTAIADIIEFMLALSAHFEPLHGSEPAIIRRIYDYRIARTAIRAIYERIKVAPVMAVHEFIAAINAGSNVRRNLRETFFYLAGYDTEFIVPDGSDLSLMYLVYFCGRRHPGLHVVKEFIDLDGCPLNFDINTL